ncbi:hypothetical protein E2C01_030962 [Portunus trituberculatus]|uniref:Uncharacterized protein n=1 Tax=Portunus trituberculatus TaxID=210409 RepID=A0A5B7ESE4_PORTR|nr:hypothetical protein [Portunus trituberculatus]
MIRNDTSASCCWGVSHAENNLKLNLKIEHFYINSFFPPVTFPIPLPSPSPSPISTPSALQVQQPPLLTLPPTATCKMWRPLATPAPAHSTLVSRFPCGKM